MKIYRVQIKNFRNFHNLDVIFGEHAVILGENKVGKSNFLYALRLVLDPSLPDNARQLQRTDFWDGLGDSLTKDDSIQISVELTDFEDDEDLMAILAEHLVQPEPMISRLTYVFQPKATLTEDPTTEADYEFFVYGGDRQENRVGYEVRSRIPMDVLPALRDAEGDLSAWRRSPLKPLLDQAASKINRQELKDIADEVLEATKAVTDKKEIEDLAQQITQRLISMAGSVQALEATLGFSPTDPERLIRAIRLFIDGGKRGIGDASLGSANLLYLVLKSLELEQLVSEGSRYHTFLGIEEPEAHLYPHLQRLVYRDFLRPRAHQDQPADGEAVRRTHQTILLTTHSPHIVSVAPLRSIILLRRAPRKGFTKAVSTAQIQLSDQDVADLERYLDVTRGEMLFAKGILLVEGDAEEYLVPVLGKLMGYDFDQFGITVCSVSGTNFLPYVKLLRKKGLGIPFAVLTDLDPQPNGMKLGEQRILKLLPKCVGKPIPDKISEAKRLKRAPRFGLFLNKHTFEVELFECGYHESMCDTIIELTDSNVAKTRAQNWRNDPSK